MKPSIAWFLGFIGPEKALLQNPNDYLLFLVKLVVAFGVCFQLSLVLMFLAYIGMITSRTLREQWRFAIVGCFAIGAIATPGGDPFSMDHALRYRW